MACNKCKNKVKSTIAFVNSAAQPIAATNTIVNPVVLALGSKVSNTGIALDLDSNAISVDASGIYRIAANVDILGTTAGDITFAIAMDGNILPESIATITMVVDIAKLLAIEVVRPINVCNAFTEHNFSLVAYSGGTGAGTVTRVSGNAIKLG